MFRLRTKENKKTLTNQLNVAGSSDNRRLNSDIIPIMAPQWGLPQSTQLPSAVSLGSAQNPWRSFTADRLYANIPRFVNAISTGSPDPPTGNPSTNGGFYYQISAATTPRRIWSWNGTAWVEITGTVPVGSVFLAGGGRRLFYVPASGNIVQGNFSSNAP